MPMWTCPKCGQKTESFSWNEKPWNGHVCRDMRKDIVDMDTNDAGKGPLTSRRRKNNLFDFF